MLTSDLERVALRLLKALNIPEADHVAQLVRDKEWDKLVKTKFDPLLHHDKSVDEFRRICLAQEFLRKADFLDTNIDKAQVARDAFLSNEAQCKRANLHLERFVKNVVLETALDQRFFELLLKAKAWIRGTLGPVPEELNGKFGPGAVFETEVWRHKTKTTTYDKLRNLPRATPTLSFQYWWKNISNTCMGIVWDSTKPSFTYKTLIVRGNRFTTVPKDATKDRGICIEPGLNVWLQLAVGNHLKLRLKRRGLDLRGDEDRVHPVLRRLGLSKGRPWKGQDLHRRIAQIASRTGAIATVDLESASDTICRVLVMLLLPDDWYSLLSGLRSSFTRFSPTGEKKDRRWYGLEKFSSMGNGYTFELETLIFASMAHAVGGKMGVDSFVYGDDIIVPQAVVADLMAMLQHAGLRINKGKTYYGDSNFRESCGGDFFFGHDVRPFYIKESPHDPSSWISIANNLRHWSLKWDMPELMAVRASTIDRIPTAQRVCGPEELGDLVLHDEEKRWTTRTRGSIRYVRIWRPVSVTQYLFSTPYQINYDWCGPTRPRSFREFSESDVALAAALTGLPSTGISPRNSVEGYRFGFVAFS